MPVRFLVHVKRPSSLPDKMAMYIYFCIDGDDDCNGGDGDGGDGNCNGDCDCDCIYDILYLISRLIFHISISLAPLIATQATVKPQQSTINGISKLFLKGTPPPMKHIVKNPASSKNPNAIFKTKALPKTTPVFRLETQTSNDLSKALAKPVPKPTTPKDSRKNKYVAGNVALTKVNTKLTGKPILKITGTAILYFIKILNIVIPNIVNIFIEILRFDSS